MKYLMAWIAGVILGAAVLLTLLYYNPFTAPQKVSPLVVSDSTLLDFTFSGVASEAIAFTNNGESPTKRAPASIAPLWEPAIRQTTVLITALHDSRGRTRGVGIKFSSASEQTNLLAGNALTDSAWHIYLPDQGTLLVGQTENFWSYGRQIVLPARWNPSDSWLGTWYGITTAGPNSIGTARVTGGSGRFAGMDSEAVEAMSARAYSARLGPVAATGNLTIAIADAAD